MSNVEETLPDQAGDGITDREKPVVQCSSEKCEIIEAGDIVNAFQDVSLHSKELPATNIPSLSEVLVVSSASEERLDVPDPELDIDVRVGGRDHTFLKYFEPGEDCRQSWKEAIVVWYEDDDVLEILGKPVVESWQTLLLRRLAAIVANKGGRILEVGFGLGISARMVQEFDIEEHVIIEANEGVYSQLLEWGSEQKNKVTPLNGFWEQVAPLLPDGSFNGIFFGASPLCEETWHTHQFEFIEKHGYRLLKPGGVLTYCNVTSWGELMKNYDNVQDMFQETQMHYLKKAGFEDIDVDIMDIYPPEDYPFYQHKDIIIPAAIK